MLGWAGRATLQLRLRAWESRLQLRQLAAVSLSIGTSAVLMAVGGVVTAHALGPEGKGVVTAVTNWGQILGWLFRVDLDTAASVRVAASEGRGAGSVMGNAILYAVVVGGVVACASAFVLSMLLARLGVDARLAAAIGMATIPLEILGPIFQSVNVALGRTRQFNRARIAAPTILLPALALMWVLTGLTPVGVILATLGGSLATLVVAGAKLPWREVTLALGVLRSDLRFGFRLLPGGLLLLANARLDLMVLSLVISAGQIGLYSSAGNATMPATLVGSAMAVLITPAVAGITPANAKSPVLAAQMQIKKIERYCLVNLAIGSMLGVMLAALAPVLVPFVFGPAFGPAVLLLWILIPGCFGHTFASTIAAGASGMRKAWVGNVVELAGFVATATLLPVLVWRYGVLGAAVASSCAYLASAAAAMLSLRILRRDLSRELQRTRCA
jgi:O-antigen/teichoic acid export membrane protein